MRLKRAENRKKNYGVIAFLAGIILAAIIVIPIMIYDKGYFIYYGDFNAQQIPFYKLAHDAIRSGNIGWNRYTDLGVNFIGSYSFYLLGSPFFWLTIPLPSEWVAYAFGPLLILKLGCCSLSAYIFLRRYVRDRRYAVLGGLLYAFSGFSVYNIFFFHFHEAMIAFPLLLAAIDEYHINHRRSVVALAVAFPAIVNYYFFFGQVIFCLIYYIIRMATKSYKFRFRELLGLLLEGVIGVMISMALMLPSLAAITGNYRLSELNLGWGGLLYNTQKYVHIICSFFFPPDLPARPNFTPKSNAKWSSVAAFLPMFSMTYVFSFMRRNKKSWLRILFIVLMIMAFVPVLNSLFQALNSAYYARWFYMLTLIMILMTISSLEHVRETEFKRGFILTASVTVGIALVIGLMPYEAFKNSITTLYRVGVEESPRRFWLFVGVSVAGLAATLICYLFLRKRPKWFFRVTAIVLCLFIVGFAEMHLFIGKRISGTPDSFIIKYALNYGEDVHLDDIDEVRSDFYKTMDNIGMYWGVMNIQAFHSIVPGSTMEYYNTLGTERNVASRPEETLYGTRSLTSVKYLFDNADYKFFKETEERHTDAMPGYKYLKTQNGYDIYLNTNYIPMGFTYDAFMTKEEYLNLSKDVKHLALLKAMVLTQTQMKKYPELCGYYEGKYLDLNSQFDENHLQEVKYPSYRNFKSITDDFVYSDAVYAEDCKNRSEHACSEFRYTDDGFSAVFENTGKDNLLFFSIPYDKGWSATVNGEAVEIEQVNIGFMAVPVKGHQTSRITFTYHTPMLKEGLIVSVAGVVLLAIYSIIMLIIKKKSAKKQPYRLRYRIKNRNNRRLHT